ncbi:hypothetical protein CUU65_00795 [Bacillus safensis]|nr:hypothetical protein CUU65_00795 [Bacillus safensis]PNU24774.1 hypothetical protein C1954_00820 [Bacillus stratosphericus]
MRIPLYNVCTLNVCVRLTNVFLERTFTEKGGISGEGNSSWAIRIRNSGKRCRKNYPRPSG